MKLINNKPDITRQFIKNVLLKNENIYEKIISD